MSDYIHKDTEDIGVNDSHLASGNHSRSALRAGEKQEGMEGTLHMEGREEEDEGGICDNFEFLYPAWLGLHSGKNYPSPPCPAFS